MNTMLRNARMNGLVGIKKATLAQGLHLFPLRHFCTTPPPPPSPSPPQNQNEKGFSADRIPNSGEDLTYARLIGIGKHTSRADIVHFFDGKLSPEDIKVEYNINFNPLSMIIQFPSSSEFESAIRIVAKKRSYRIDRVDPRMWNIQSYHQKVVLLQGLPRNAQPEDIARFLCGCEFNSNFHLFIRGYNRMALVQFPSQIQAMNAVLAKNRSFCLNSQILMQILH